MSDFSQTRAVQERLVSVTKKLHEMAPAVGSARTIRQYDSDRRKRLLSLEVIRSYKNGSESATEAEHHARASDNYKIGLDALAGQLEEAEKVLSEWDALQAAWDTG